MPTVLELAGVRKPDTWEGEPIPAAPGVSLAPLFANDQPLARESLWWLHEGNRAVRVGNWKLVADKDQPWELYDLAKDRAEQNNLASAMPGKMKQLEAVWQQQTTDFSALVQKTIADQPKPRAKKAKK